MPEYLAPGVYVEEVDAGIPPIEGVSTSTAGFVGMSRRGPLSGLPQLVTSFADFQRRFGGYFDFGPTFAGYNYLPFAVDGFFTNGGKRLYVMRIAPTSATQASTVATGGMITRLASDTAIAPAPARRKLTPTSLRGIRVGTKLQLHMVKNGVATDSPLLTVQAVDRTTGEVTVDVDISSTVVFEARSTTVLTDVNGLDAGGLPTSLTNITDPRANSFTLTAKDKGSWGNDIVVQAFHESWARGELDAFVSGAVDNTKIRLKSTAGFYASAWVEIDRGNTKRYRQVKAVDGTVVTLLGPAMAAGDVAPELPAPNNVTVFSTCEFRLNLLYDGSGAGMPPSSPVVESFGGLTLANVPGRFVLDQINTGSTLVTLSAVPAQTQPFLFPSGADGLRIPWNTAGIDGTATPTDLEVKGTDLGPGQKSGIKALEDIDEISIIAAPGLTSQVIQDALINQCENLMDRFAILDPAPLANNKPPGLTDIQNQRSLFDTKYAAIYYPRILTYDPVSQASIPIPPGGHVAGIYARVDIERGVHKAPANEVIRGITGLELSINKAEHDILNPRNIDVLRDFRSSNRGYRVWGARCITSDSEWKYVNVRRLFIFLEESLDEGTQWVVFEPNDEPLWARVRQSVTFFLTRVWHDGALMGSKPEEAFFVRCDRSTMTDDDILNGRLILLIGVAPVRPAEFVIIRIGQWLGGSAVQEL